MHCKITRSQPTTNLLASCFFVLALIMCPISSANSDQDAVGSVTLILGKSFRYSGDQTSETLLTKGMSIHAGDQIETRSNGHVHIRFVDGAMVSIRPNSRLTIKQYSFDRKDPTQSLVKFELEEGVTRAISGSAAKDARDRFRLNTPIAAIGVRGTDFVVSASAGVTKAMVNEGAIIVAPFSDACRFDGIGPCSQDALELSGNSVGLAAIDQTTLLPRLISPQSLRTSDFMQLEAQRAIARSGSEADATGPQTVTNSQSTQEEGVRNEVILEGVTTVQVRASAEIAVNKVKSTDFVPIDPISVSGDGSIVRFDYTPPKLLTSDQLRDRQLVWGRYFSSPQLTDRLTLPFKEASLYRTAVVGTTEFGLFRLGDGSRVNALSAGMVGFQLTSAQAVFNAQTGIFAMSVDDGDLTIDFNDKSFETILSLSSSSTGQINFSATGQLIDGGFLRALESTQSLRGAISLDGTEAGYHFEKELPSGKLSGLTLWDSK